MEVLYGIGIALGGLIMVMILRSFTTLFHELGHAIPALTFSSDKVKVYIGTYGSTDQVLPLKMGRLEIYFKFNILAWNTGMCSHGRTQGLWKNFIIVLGGPVASLLISVPLFVFLINNAINPLISFGIAIFIMAASLDFISNLIPMGKQINLDGGSAIFNDGMQLILLFKRSRLPDVYFEMEKLIDEKEYVTAIERGRSIILNQKSEPALYDLMITALFAVHEYEDIITALKLKSQYYELSPHDYHQMGIAHTKLNHFEKALKFLNQAIYKHYDNAQMLIDRGYLHLQRSDPHAAFDDCNAAIQYNPALTKAVLYRSLALIRLEEPEDALHDLDVLIKHEPDNALAWFYLGMAHEELKNDNHAFDSYTMAKQLGCTAHGLDYRLQLTEPN